MALLSGFALFAEAHPHGSTIRTVTATLSAALAFIFCGIIYGIISALRYQLFNRKTTNKMMTSLATNGGSDNDEKQPLLKAQGSDRITATYGFTA